MKSRNEEQVELQQAFIIHLRPFQDRKQLVELLTEDYGRVGAVMRSPTGKRKSLSGRVQPFGLVTVSWSGKSELKSLTQIEYQSLPHQLQGDYLLSGLYANEVLMRALHRDVPVPEVFRVYQDLLANLNAQKPLEPCLRQFEYRLLQHLGYGFDWHYDVLGQSEIVATQHYQFKERQGFSRTHNLEDGFLGQTLLDIHQGQLLTETQLRTAKRVLKQALKSLIGTEPLKSREIFQQNLKVRTTLNDSN